MYLREYILHDGRWKMRTSKVFISGNSQAIRLPKEFRVEEKELYIQKIGRAIILFPKDKPWALFEDGLSEFTEEFMSDGRNQPPLQEREKI